MAGMFKALSRRQQGSASTAAEEAVAAEAVSDQYCKVLRRRMFQDSDSFRSKVLSGVEAHAAVTGHANIAALYGCEKEGRNAYHVYMENAGPRTLQQHIATAGSLRESTVQRGVRQLLKALAYMHSKGIVHRDVKPENVVVSKDGRTWKLIDLTEAAWQGQHTWFAGTLQFLAPEYVDLAVAGGSTDEQAVGAVTSVKLDVWALGALVYTCLTGVEPFDSCKTIDRLSEAVMQGSLPFIASGPKLSSGAESFIRACMTFSAGARPTCQHLQKHPWLAPCSHSHRASKLQVHVSPVDQPAQR